MATYYMRIFAAGAVALAALGWIISPASHYAHSVQRADDRCIATAVRLDIPNNDREKFFHNCKKHLQ